MNDTDHTPTSPLPEGPQEAADAAALIVWNAGLGADASTEAEDPYEEDMDLDISEGRSDWAQKAISTAWGEVADEAVEDGNWDYLHNARKETFQRIWERSTGPRGPAHAAWSQAVAQMEAREGEDFDEDDFEEAAREAAWEICREEGLEHLHEIVPRLVGSRRATTDLGVGTLEGAVCELEAFVPDFKRRPAEWAEFLCALKIHPADFARAVRERVAESIDDADTLYDASPESLRESKEALREALRAQGMGRAPSRSPASWREGMDAVAKSWAAMGASLPPADAKPLADAKWILEILGRQGESAGFEIELGIDGDALQEHSDLIERFGANSPLCLEGGLAQSLAALSPSMFIEGEEVRIDGALALSVDDISWADGSSDDDNLEAAQAKARQGASKAQQLTWRLAPGHGEAPSEASPKALALARELAAHDPRSMRWGMEMALSRGASPQASAQAQEAFELSKAAIDARLAKNAKPDPSAPKPRALQIDDFDVREGVVGSAPWRGEVTPALARKRDSLGNSLAHKAVFGLDGDLLRHALACDPESALAKNRAGLSPLDALLGFGATQGAGAFASLAKAVASARPDLASFRGAAGLSLLERAFALGSDAAATALVGAGARFDEPNPGGFPAWRRCVYLKAHQFAQAARKAVEMGWNIDAPDAEGRTLAGLCKDPGAVLELMRMGASLPDGHSLDPKAFAEVEAKLLSAPTPPAPSSPKRSRAL